MDVKASENKTNKNRRGFSKLSLGRKCPLLQGSSASTVTRGAGNVGLYYGKYWEIDIPEIKAYILMLEFFRFSN